jgi:hypothetical protein
MFSAPFAYAQTPRFRVINITPLNFTPSVTQYGSMGINSLGEVVFAWQDGSDLHPFVWLPEANSNYSGIFVGFNDLYDASENSVTGIARDLNDAGVVVGQAGDGTYSNGQAATWDLVSGGVVDLLGFRSESSFNSWSGAEAVNNDDPPLIVGGASIDGFCMDSNCSNPGLKATIYQGFKLDLGDAVDDGDLLGPSAYNSTFAHGVSTPTSTLGLHVAGGSVCAFSGCFFEPVSCEPNHEPTRWPSVLGVQMDAISDPDDVGSFGRGVSDTAHTVGWARDAEDINCKRHAVYWEQPTSTLFDLSGDSMPAGQTGNAAWAEAVNNPEFPSIVGWNTDLNTAILWEQDSLGNWTATDLNDEITCSSKWLILQAHDINDNGWIAAIAQDISNPTNFHAVVLVPFAECLGDQTCDGIVATDDLLIVVNNWGTCPSSGPCPGDLTEDGTVDTDDLLIVINGWGICDAGSSSLMGGSGAGQEDIFEVLQGLGLPSELLESIQELLGL